MSSQSKEVSCLETLTENQEKLAKLEEKLETIKKKYLADKNLDLDYKIFQKEAESLESDIKFIRSLLDGLKNMDNSLTSRFFRRVLPGRSLSQGWDVSKEFKSSVMAFSTKFFEDKVKYLENSVKDSRKHKKKSHRKKTTQDVCSSATHSPSEESTTLRHSGREEKTKVSNLLKNNSIFLRLNEEESQNISAQGVKENEANENSFTPQNFVKLEVDKEITKTPQPLLVLSEKKSTRDFTPCLAFSPSYLTVEKSVQTDTYNFVPKISTSKSCVFEKCIQTESFDQSYIMNEILEALKKVGEVYSVPSDRSPLYNTEDAISNSSAASSPSDLLLWRTSEATGIVESVVNAAHEFAPNSPASRTSYDGLSEHNKKNYGFRERAASSDLQISKLKGRVNENSICNEGGNIPASISRDDNLVEDRICDILVGCNATKVKLCDGLRKSNNIVDIKGHFLDYKTVDGEIKTETKIIKSENEVNMSSDGDMSREWFRTKKCTGILYPFVYHCRETMGQVDGRESLSEEGTNAFHGLSLQLSRHQTAEENTLQIVYRHSPNKTGKIIVTEFGQAGTTTQSEIVGRIISYLIGLPPPNDKT